MTKPITKRQNDVLEFIKQFIAKEGYAPTLREIGDGINMKSSGMVHAYLVELRDKGLVTWKPNDNRTIKVIGDESTPAEQSLKAAVAVFEKAIEISEHARTAIIEGRENYALSDVDLLLSVFRDFLSTLSQGTEASQ